MQSHVTEFKAALKKLVTIGSIPEVTRHAWDYRLNQIDNLFNNNNALANSGRVKRGLLNFVGVVGKKLFGLATEGEVNELRKHIELSSANSQHVTHVINQLVSVVNQSHDQIKENRLHISKIEHYTSKLADNVINMENLIDEKINDGHRLAATIQLGDTLAAIKSAQTAWLRQYDTYARQKASLEMGWLTEETLPPRDLLRILSAENTGQFSALPMHWYYAHVSVRPLWEEGDTMVFKAELPFSDSTRYLQYNLRSWPIKGTKPGYSIQFTTPPEVALNTESGNLFVPRTCVGEHPRVCRSGPLYDRGAFKCVRGLLTGETSLRKACKVSLTRSVEEDDIVEEVSNGIFAISSPSHGYSIHCGGQPERRMRIAEGLHLLRLKAGCTARGAGWVISGVQTMASNVSFTFPVVPTPELALPDLLSTKVLEKHLNSPTWDALGRVTDISLSNVPPNDPPFAIPSWAYTLAISPGAQLYRW